MKEETMWHKCSDMLPLPNELVIIKDDHSCYRLCKWQSVDACFRDTQTIGVYYEIDEVLGWCEMPKWDL